MKYLPMNTSDSIKCTFFMLSSSSDYFIYISAYTHVKTICFIVNYPIPGVTILTNLILHYVRKPSCKYELFWFSYSQQDFEMTLILFVIISTLMRI
jgi:hypothetical protein